MTEKLSSRVERLEGPDREIFLAAYEACYLNGWTPWASDDCHKARFELLVAKEAWLSAAEMLVPEGISEWHCGRHSKAGQCPRTGIEIKGGGDAYMVRGREPIYVMAATPAIALCAAALKSRGL